MCFKETVEALYCFNNTSKGEKEKRKWKESRGGGGSKDGEQTSQSPSSIQSDVLISLAQGKKRLRGKRFSEKPSDENQNGKLKRKTN